MTSVIEQLREDLLEVAKYLGVRPMYWNGAHSACINQTNVSVKYFKTRYEAKAWCVEKNKIWETENRIQAGNHIDDELLI